MKYTLLVIILAFFCLSGGSPSYYVNNQRAINLYDADVDCSLSISTGEEPTAYVVYETGTNRILISDCLARNRSVIYLLLSNQTYVVVVYDMHGRASSRHVVYAIKEHNYVVDFD